MVEVQRAPEAHADLVDHAHEQEVGEKQPAAFQVTQVCEPDQHVGMKEQQAEVEPAGSTVTDAQHEPGGRGIPEVGGDELLQPWWRERRAAAPAL